MHLKAAFLDIDGTLVDSNEFHVMAWDEAFRAAGMVADKNQIRKQIGKGADLLIPALFPQALADQCDAVARRHGEIFHTRYLHQVKPFAHASDLLEMMYAKGLTIILASSAERAEIGHYCDLLKAKDWIDGTVSKDDVATSKPAGDIFAAALAQVFPLAASETLAVGDTPYDIESAARSNIRTIALRSGGWSTEALAGAGAASIYASVQALFEDFADSPLNA